MTRSFLLSFLFPILLFAACLTAGAQQFGNSWMHCPEPDDTSHVWFCRTFLPEKAASPAVSTAFLHVATTGRFVLYVNGRNVSTSLYMPRREGCDTTAIGYDFDVRRFLRRDTNTVAILFCPSSATRRQLSVCFYGTLTDGKRFALTGADGWLCRQSGGWQTDGGESFDRSAYCPSPADRSLPLAMWQAAEDCKPATDTPPIRFYDYGLTAEALFGYSPRRHNMLTDNAAHVMRVSHPLYTQQTEDSLVCHFAPGQHGFVRVTLRGCQRGETLRIADFLYVCSSDDDEQAFARFTPTASTSVVITGDSNFQAEQVQLVELLETE